jgi:RES domain-containing protein
MASRSDRPALIAYRIADSRYPILDGTGAALIGGRWNSPGREVKYASLSYAAAMLERLVHAGTGRVPRNQKSVIITIPARVAREELSVEQLPGDWDSEDCLSARAVGDAWLDRRRGAVLIVRSVVARYEKSVLINPRHPNFRWISVSEPEEVRWDVRLFGPSDVSCQGDI